MEERLEIEEYQKTMEELKRQLEEEAAERHLRELEAEADRVVEDEEEYDDHSTEPLNQTFEQTLRFLDDMVGMEHIKQRLIRLGRYTEWIRMQEFQGIDVSGLPKPNLTFLFLGDPGTGKTTVARHMADILFTLGLIDRHRVYTVQREDLLGECYGSAETRTKALLEESGGAVLFLDEAYRCYRKDVDARDPGTDILETLMPEFGQPGRCIIMAGYTQEMMKMLQVNSGFRSRIPQENIFNFDTPDETTLMKIAERQIQRMQLRLSPKAKQLLRQSIHNQHGTSDRNFGNARQMCQMASALAYAHANRIMANPMQADNLLINVADMTECLQNAIPPVQQAQKNRMVIRGFSKV